jgi:hypothetical protein
LWTRSRHPSGPRPGAAQPGARDPVTLLTADPVWSRW